LFTYGFSGKVQSTGKALLYLVPNGGIAGLTSGGTYYAVMDPSNPSLVQLAATPGGNKVAFQSAGSAGQSLVPLNDMPLYASGGDVTVNADTIQGSGTVTANGGPSINVTNDSPDYLLLGAIDIPNIPGGQVNFTGAARMPGSQVFENTPSLQPTVTIDQAYSGYVGGVNSGPALFVTGPIDNPGGTVFITSIQGSYGQLSAINAQIVNFDIENGVFTVSTPTSPDPLQQLEAQWNSEMIWPGGESLFFHAEPGRCDILCRQCAVQFWRHLIADVVESLPLQLRC